MLNPTKFEYLFEYYIFNFALLSLVCSELFIFAYTAKNSDRGRAADKGTKWLLYLNFAFCVFISFFAVSHSVPESIRSLAFPNRAAEVGIVFIFSGVILRLSAVMTLKKAFTLNVQTKNEQRLVTTGLYAKLRHPAYSGSILSLLGTALALRSVIAVCLVLICCFICYSVRIRVEERALLGCFGEEYEKYKRGTYKLLPHVL